MWVLFGFQERLAQFHASQCGFCLGFKSDSLCHASQCGFCLGFRSDSQFHASQCGFCLGFRSDWPSSTPPNVGSVWVPGVTGPVPCLSMWVLFGFQERLAQFHASQCGFCLGFGSDWRSSMPPNVGSVWLSGVTSSSMTLNLGSVWISGATGPVPRLPMWVLHSRDAHVHVFPPAIPSLSLSPASPDGCRRYALEAGSWEGWAHYNGLDNIKVILFDLFFPNFFTIYS